MSRRLPTDPPQRFGGDVALYVILAVCVITIIVVEAVMR
jgi:hypothetical protein